MLLFVLEQIAFCIGIILEKYYWFDIVLFFCIGILLEKYGFHIVFYFFLYWKSIGLTLVYVAFRVGKDCFLIGIILEKYWFKIVL